jgi:type IV pilus assembly protein PilN
MIRINLLGVERKQQRRAAAFDVGRQITLLCSLILVAAALGVGYWFLSLRQASAQMDADVAAAQSQAAQLKSILGEVEKFEARKKRLQDRVALIEQLRGGQSIPVQMLDHVSRSLPDMLWLTSMEQKDAAVTIEGRSTTLIGLSDFVANLGNGALFKKPIEIVDSQVQATGAGAAALELIQFTVKADLATPPAGAAAPAAATPARR